MPTAEGIAVGNAISTAAPASVIRPCTTNTARSVLMSPSQSYPSRENRHNHDEQLRRSMTVGGEKMHGDQFEEHRPHLRAVAYRMLGSLSEADDAVQDAWLRVSGSDARGVANLRGWLTTIIARVCLNVLRSRQTHHEEPLGERLPDPLVTAIDSTQPEEEALLADSVGIALLVVLDTLAPAERLAFLVHDVFNLPF